MSTATKSKPQAHQSKKVKLQPLGDRVVVEREESEGRTAGGIVLPDTAKDKPARGTVISVGDGRLLDDGTPPSAASQGGRPRALLQLCRRAVQDRRPRTAADARRRHPRRHRVEPRSGIRKNSETAPPSSEFSRIQLRQAATTDN